MTPLFLIVSRGRPEYLEETIASINSKTADIARIYIGLDQDDAKLQDYIMTVDKFIGINKRLLQKRTGELYLSRLVNELYSYVDLYDRKNADVIIPFADDIIIQTDCWNEILHVRAPSDGLFIAYPFDGFNFHCTIPMISKRVVDMAGYVGPECLHHWYCDDWWGDIGKRAHCILPLPEVTFLHLAPHNPATAERAPNDDVFARQFNRKEIQNDNRTFNSIRAADEREGIAEKIRAERLNDARKGK